MTQIQCFSSDVDEAAQWLADEKEPPARVAPTLRERIGLTMKQAREVCAMAHHFRTERRALP